MTAFSALIELISKIGQAALTTSPFFLLIGLTRTPRNAVYIAPESLVMIAISYAYRFGRADLQRLFAFGVIGESIHLVGLIASAYLVFRIQGRIVLPKRNLLPPPASTDSSSSSGGGGSDSDSHRSAHGHETSRKVIKGSMIRIFAYLAGIVAYDSFVSIFVYAAMRYKEGSNASYHAAWLGFLPVYIVLLEIVGLYPQYQVMIDTNRAKASLPHSALPSPEGVGLDEQKRRLRMPMIFGASWWRSRAVGHVCCQRC